MYWSAVDLKAGVFRCCFVSHISAPSHSGSRKQNQQQSRCHRPQIRLAVSANQSYSPLSSLVVGTWFKLICGASSQDLPRIRNLAFLYSLLGADCIDAAADSAVVASVRAGISAARNFHLSKRYVVQAQDDVSSEIYHLQQLLQLYSPEYAHRDPLLMVSVNDDEDPHFRKAIFDPSSCPHECSRPCERVCPANAIDTTGVLNDICYGCGRCVPICPSELISTLSFVHTPASVMKLIADVDAVEIHTQAGHEKDFTRLWREISEVSRAHLKLIAVSFPYPGTEDQLVTMLRSFSAVLSDIPPSISLVWQTDGRPMSGDIGRGMSKASVKLASLVCKVVHDEQLPGYVQPAGGTNDATAALLEKAGLLQAKRGVAGIAFGGYARKVVAPVLDELARKGVRNLEDDTHLLCQSVALAGPLVNALKTRRLPDISSIGHGRERQGLKPIPGY